MLPCRLTPLAYTPYELRLGRFGEVWRIDSFERINWRMIVKYNIRINHIILNYIQYNIVKFEHPTIDLALIPLQLLIEYIVCYGQDMVCGGGGEGIANLAFGYLFLAHDATILTGAPVL